MRSGVGRAVETKTPLRGCRSWGRLAEAGAAIPFYYGLRRAHRLLRPLLVTHDGAIKRKPVGDEIRARAGRQRAENWRPGSERSHAADRADVSGDWSYRLREHKGTLLAFAAFS